MMMQILIELATQMSFATNVLMSFIDQVTT